MTHGGLGSVNEVSYFGKPTIMVSPCFMSKFLHTEVQCPLSGDQMRNAKMLERHNGSIEFSKYDLHNEKVVANAFRKILYDERLVFEFSCKLVKSRDYFLKEKSAAFFEKIYIPVTHYLQNGSPNISNSNP